LAGSGLNAHTQTVANMDDVWRAIRRFFVHQAGRAEAESTDD